MPLAFISSLTMKLFPPDISDSRADWLRHLADWLTRRCALIYCSSCFELLQLHSVVVFACRSERLGNSGEKSSKASDKGKDIEVMTILIYCYIFGGGAQPPRIVKASRVAQAIPHRRKSTEFYIRPHFQGRMSSMSCIPSPFILISGIRKVRCLFSSPRRILVLVRKVGFV